MSARDYVDGLLKGHAAMMRLKAQISKQYSSIVGRSPGTPVDSMMNGEGTTSAIISLLMIDFGARIFSSESAEAYALSLSLSDKQCKAAAAAAKDGYVLEAFIRAECAREEKTRSISPAGINNTIRGLHHSDLIERKRFGVGNSYGFRLTEKFKTIVKEEMKK